MPSGGQSRRWAAPRPGSGGDYALSMATEIERKFLLDGPPGQIQGRAGRRIEQGYVTSRESVEVRLRQLEEQRLLTAKLGHGETRVEIEIAVDANQFDALWPLTEPRRLRKTRHRVPLGEGLEAEVDVFEGDLAGLVTAEVEFGASGRAGTSSTRLARHEVTGERRYANQSLALEGTPLFAAQKAGRVGRGLPLLPPEGQ